MVSIATTRTEMSESQTHTQTNPPTVASYERFCQARYFASLDGVRAFCILAVIFHHIPTFTNVPHVLHLGFLGVDVFFVLSGILIESLIVRERSRRGSFALRSFYVRRSLRILPAYYLQLGALLIGLAAFRPNSEVLQTYIHELPKYLTFTCNWTSILTINMFIMWSLATEEQFYLVWPFIEKYVRAQLGFVLLIIALVGNQAVNFGLFDGWIRQVYGTGEVPNILQITFTPIILGVLLGRLLHSPRSFAAFAWWIGRRSSPILLAIVLGGLLVLAPLDLAGWPRALIQVVMTLLVGSLMIREDHWAAGLLRWPPLRRIGIISYGAYLYHMTAIHAARAILGRFETNNPWLMFVLATALTMILAEVSFRLLEIPILRLKPLVETSSGHLLASLVARSRLGGSILSRQT